MEKKGRIADIDCVRAICMIWIVCIYHMRGYMGIEQSEHLTNVYNNITTMALGSFTFISALFLGKRKIVNRSDVIKFYVSRVYRIYPLFLISCLSLFVMGGINGTKSLIRCLFGVCIFFEPVPRSVWYISMLIFFYLLTPLVNYINAKHGIVKAMMVPLIILSTIYLLDTLAAIRVDRRLYVYYPIYFGTLILTAHNNLQTTNISKTGISLVVVLVFCIPRFYSLLTRFPVVQCLYSVAGIVTMCAMGKLVNYSFLMRNIFERVSYGSMIMYLFHRQFFGLVYKFSGDFSYPLAVMLCVVLFVISFYTQKAYDTFLDIIIKRSERT